MLETEQLKPGPEYPLAQLFYEKHANHHGQHHKPELPWQGRSAKDTIADIGIGQEHHQQYLNGYADI